MTISKGEQVGFRITPGEKSALEELVRRRHTETGDDSATGWFRALLRREAKAANLAIVEPGEERRGAALPTPKKGTTGKAKR